MPMLRQSLSNSGSLIEHADRNLQSTMLQRVLNTFGSAFDISWTASVTDGLLRVFARALAFFRILHEQRSEA